MSRQKSNTSTTDPVVRTSATLALALCALLMSSVALAVDSGDILVVSLKGEVFVTMSGAKRPMRAGSVLEPPATLRTGRDGAVELRQGATTLSVGPETVLEFPALEKRGAPIDRIVQPRGNVFYNIGKREGRKLRIETPFLVGVVKGTQFNVAAQDETTTISLFEGLLEVHAADESGVVDLRAGEIASRQREDKGVNVLKMDGPKAPVTPSRQPAGSGSNISAPKPAPQRVIPHHQDRDSVLVNRSAAAVGVGASVADVAVPRDTAPASLGTGGTMNIGAPAVEVSPATPVNVSADTAESGATASAPAAAPTTEVAASANVDVGLDSDKPGFTVINGSSSHLVEVTVGSANAAEAVASSGDGNGNDNGSDNGNGNGNGSGNGNSGPGVEVTVDLGVDLGLNDSSATTPDTDNSGSDKPGHGPPADIVDLLDGLNRRRGKK